MASFDIKIDERAFRDTGCKPIFDENLYGELLDEFSPDAPHLNLSLTADFAWRYGRVGGLFKGLADPSNYFAQGGYDRTEDERSLGLLCRKSEPQTNNTLLHETKHFIDDADEDISLQALARDLRKVGIIGLGAMGVVSGVALRDPYVVLASGGVSVASVVANYRFNPLERAAFKFAKSPEVTEAYGRIIQYASVG